MSFAQRPPSATWEAVPIAGTPQLCAWVWFKPAGFPQGLFVQVPAEVRRDPAAVPLLTLRNLLHSAGIDAASVASWHFCGAAYEGQGGANPLFDQPVPAPPPGADPNIAVVIEAAPMPAMQTAPLQGAAPAPAMPVPAAGGAIPAPCKVSTGAAALFDRIDVDWQAAQTLETQLTTLRRQLADLMARLNALNRDLNPEERLHGERKDKSDWLIARRWLRDFMTRISRCIKEQDIGDATYAGRRAWFEDTYAQQIAPRQPFAGLAEAQREYETYRKLVQSQLASANGVYTAARQDGERRAQEVLKRIAASVRAARAKR